MVSICHTCGLKSITRIEQSRIYLLPEIPDEYERQSTIADLYDRATEQVYPEPLKTFSLNIKPEPVTIVPLKEKGIQALFDLPGWSLDKADTEYMMPHPERSFLKWQWAYLPYEFDKRWPASPWLRMFQNAWVWCQENKL